MSSSFTTYAHNFISKLPSNVLQKTQNNQNSNISYLINNSNVTVNNNSGILNINNNILVINKFPAGVNVDQILDNQQRKIKSSSFLNNIVSNNRSIFTKAERPQEMKGGEDISSQGIPNLERLDQRGVPIIKRGKKHKITFADKNKKVLVERIDVESFKKYNVPNTFDDRNEKDKSTSCCLIS